MDGDAAPIGKATVSNTSVAYAAIAESGIAESAHSTAVSTEPAIPNSNSRARETDECAVKLSSAAAAPRDPIHAIADCKNGQTSACDRPRGSTDVAALVAGLMMLPRVLTIPVAITS